MLSLRTLAFVLLLAGLALAQGSGIPSDGTQSPGDGCANPPNRDNCETCEEDGKDGADCCSGEGGRVDALSGNYVHAVTDYVTPDASATPPCATCGEWPESPSGAYPRLMVRRTFRLREHWAHSHFGPKTRSNFEFKIVRWVVGNVSQIRITHPDGKTEVFNDFGTGNWVRWNPLEPNAYTTIESEVGDVIVFRRRDGSRLHVQWWGQDPSGQEDVGRVTRIEDRNGNALTFVNDDAKTGYDCNQPDAIIDCFGRRIDIEWSPVGACRYITKVTLPGSPVREIRYHYDGNAWFRIPTRIVHPNGETSRRWQGVDADGPYYVFNDVVGNPTSRKDRVYWYSINGAVRGIKDPAGNLRYTRSWVLRSDGGYTINETVRGKRLETRTDASNRLLSQACLDTGDTYTFTMDPAVGLGTTSTDPAGNVTQWSWDADGNNLSKTTADAATIGQTFNQFGQVTSRTDELGRVTSHTYDAAGNLLRTDHPDGSHEAWTYPTPNYGKPVSHQARTGEVMTFVYDAYANLVRTILPGTAQPAYEYVHDASYRRISTRDPDGFVVLTDYDVLDRTVMTTFADATTERIVYGVDDPNDVDGDGDTAETAGLVVAMIDRNGMRRDREYDPNDRLVREFAPYGPNAQGQYVRPAGLASRDTTYDPVNELPVAVDHHGDLTTFLYDAKLRLRMRSRHADSGTVLTTTFEYDPLDEVVREVDPYGFVTEYTYDAVQRLVMRRRFTDLAGTEDVVDSTTYRLDGSIATRTDGNGRTTTWSYDGAGNERGRILPATTDAGGQTTNAAAARSLTSFVGGRRVRADHADGGQTDYHYDVRGLPSEERRYVDAQQTQWNSLQRVWSPGGNLVQSTMVDEGGVIARRELRDYTCCGRLARLRVVMNPSGTPDDRLDLITVHAYDGNGNLITEVDPEGMILERSYDERNRLTRVVNLSMTPPFTLMTRQYLDDGSGFDARLASGQGRVEIETDGNGDATTTVYDGVGRVIRVIDALGQSTVTTYDAVEAGLVVTRTSTPQGSLRARSVDGIGRVVRVAEEMLPGTPAVSHEHQWNYFGNGHRRLRVIDPTGRISVARFDQRDQPIRQTRPGGEQLHQTHDQMGRVLGSDDALGRTTAFEYDLIGRMTAIVEPSGRRRTMGYDPNGSVVVRTDGEGNATLYTYDLAGRPVLETYADHVPGSSVGTVSFTWNGDGTLARRTDQAGHMVSFTYDPRKLVTLEQHRGGSGPAGKIGYTYDGEGRLLGYVDSLTRTSMRRTYDALGRVTSERQNPLGVDPEKGLLITTAHDDAARTRTITYPSGRTIVRELDVRGQLSQVREGATALASYTRDAAGRKTARAVGNGLVSTFQYDLNGRLSSLSDDVGGQAINAFTYTWDANDNRTLRSDSLHPGNGEFQAFDALDRLDDWSRGAVSGGQIPAPDRRRTWNLSVEGDWLGSTLNGVAETRTHNAAHEIVSAGGSPLTHDPDGNLLSDGNLEYEYDRMNRLVAVKSAATQVTLVQYGYDTSGRRVRRSTLSGTTITYYDGWNAIEERDDANALLATTVYGDYNDEVIVRQAASGASWYPTQDERYSTTAVTDASGALVERRRYDPYGRQDVHTSAGPDGAWFTPDDVVVGASPIGFATGYTGREHDPSTGLIHFRRRDLHPGLGRFLTRDPTGYADGLNLYEAYFVPGSLDPLGLKAKKKTCKLVFVQEAGGKSPQSKKGIIGLPWVVGYPGNTGAYSLKHSIKRQGGTVVGTASSTGFFEEWWWLLPEFGLASAETDGKVSCACIKDECVAIVTPGVDSTSVDDYWIAMVKVTGTAKGPLATLTVTVYASMSVDSTTEANVGIEHGPVKLGVKITAPPVRKAIRATRAYDYLCEEE